MCAEGNAQQKVHFRVGSVERPSLRYGNAVFGDYVVETGFGIEGNIRSARRRSRQSIDRRGYQHPSEPYREDRCRRVGRGSRQPLAESRDVRHDVVETGGCRIGCRCGNGSKDGIIQTADVFGRKVAAYIFIQRSHLQIDIDHLIEDYAECSGGLHRIGDGGYAFLPFYRDIVAVLEIHPAAADIFLNAFEDEPSVAPRGDLYRQSCRRAVGMTGKDRRRSALGAETPIIFYISDSVFGDISGSAITKHHVAVPRSRRVSTVEIDVILTRIHAEHDINGDRPGVNIHRVDYRTHGRGGVLRSELLPDIYPHRQFSGGGTCGSAAQVFVDTGFSGRRQRVYPVKYPDRIRRTGAPCRGGIYRHVGYFIALCQCVSEGAADGGVIA